MTLRDGLMSSVPIEIYMRLIWVLPPLLLLLLVIHELIVRRERGIQSKVVGHALFALGVPERLVGILQDTVAFHSGGVRSLTRSRLAKARDIEGNLVFVDKAGADRLMAFLIEALRSLAVKYSRNTQPEADCSFAVESIALLLLFYNVAPRSVARGYLGRIELVMGWIEAHPARWSVQVPRLGSVFDEDWQRRVTWQDRPGEKVVAVYFPSVRKGDQLMIEAEVCTARR